MSDRFFFSVAWSTAQQTPQTLRLRTESLSQFIPLRNSNLIRREKDKHVKQ